LDVAVGSGSVEMTKYLLEFHGARPTRETLKQSISTGNLDLIKLMRERLPEGELRDRVDLLEVAAEFHQEEVLEWLLRDVSVFDRELLRVFAVDRKLANSLVVALKNGFRPWWNCVRDVALKWRASAVMEFVSAPEGFSSDGGWWTDGSGVTSALPGLALGGGGGPGRPPRTHRVHSAFNGEWTKALSQAHLGGTGLVKSVVFPSGTTAIDEGALRGFEVLESVVVPASCTVIRMSAFENCKTLNVVHIPVGCTATGVGAFAGCTSLVNVMIPVGCTTVSPSSFRDCSSLRKVRIPDGCALIGSCAFWWSGLKEVVIPDCCRIEERVFCQCTALRSVSIGRGCASIGGHAFYGCSALATVTMGLGCASIGEFAFSGCLCLASVKLPTSVRGISTGGFGYCFSLATIAIPKGCQVNSLAFDGCNALVTVF
jgi:hypothetical protein